MNPYATESLSGYPDRIDFNNMLKDAGYPTIEGFERAPQVSYCDFKVVANWVIRNRHRIHWAGKHEWTSAKVIRQFVVKELGHGVTVGAVIIAFNGLINGKMKKDESHIPLFKFPYQLL
jgi:hypothetical protein